MDQHPGRRPGGAVALTGLVTFLMLFGLAASPIPFDVPVLDRIADIAVLSLYTIGATALLLPPPAPRWPAGPRRPTGGQLAMFSYSTAQIRTTSRSRNDLQLTRTHALLRTHQEVIDGNGK